MTFEQGIGDGLESVRFGCTQNCIGDSTHMTPPFITAEDGQVFALAHIWWETAIAFSWRAFDQDWDLLAITNSGCDRRAS